MEFLFGFMGLAQIINHFSQNISRNLQRLKNLFNLIHDFTFRDKQLLFRVFRIAADQIDVFALFQVAGHSPTGYGAFDKPAKDKGRFGFLDGLCAFIAKPGTLTGIKHFLAYQGRVIMPVFLAVQNHNAIVKRVLDHPMQSLRGQGIAFKRSQTPILRFAAQFVQGTGSGRIFLKQALDQKSAFLIDDNGAVPCFIFNVKIAKRRFADPFALFQLMVHATHGIIGQAVDILLGQKNLCFPHKHFAAAGVPA